MNKKTIAVIATLLLLIFSGKVLLSPKKTVTANSSSALSFDLFQKLDRNENIVYSPISAEMVLSLVYTGAKGIAKGNMEKILSFNEDTHSQNENTLDYLESIEEITLNCDNGFWIKNNINLKDQYREEIDDYYYAEIGTFADVNKVADRINAWVDKNTEGLIKKLLTPETIDPLTEAFFVNTIYLDAPWLHSFKPQFTKKGSFDGINGEKQVEYMTQQNNFLYAHIKDKAQILELPYKDKDTSIIFFLPERDSGYYFENLMNDFNAETFYSWYNQLRINRVDVTIPKFETKMRVDIKAKMPELFENLSDLSGISDLFHEGSDANYKAFQEALIIVDEKGTKAAAATTIFRATRSGRFRPITFKADHPFVYVIYNKALNRIIFMGSYVK